MSRLNFGVRMLTPKTEGAGCIKHFHLIVLISVIFKIIAKAYATRFSGVTHTIISSSQTTFIKGRLILDGSLALQEIVHKLRIKNLGGVLLKLDFMKAYDRVNWKFLRRVMPRKGFDAGYIHRIM